MHAVISFRCHQQHDFLWDAFEASWILAESLKVEDIQPQKDRWPPPRSSIKGEDGEESEEEKG